ncbi:HP0495 family protein [Simiduia aestuariiviva]|uniref:UPF0250 protein FHS30_002481 n=1 Tax=Simiduia aestuariiviva TaxID=1510459 RepID=A0A839UNG3_9GAMM|nr:DUF493 domain-containing protein [Simiduia aestuariiviva]MBB3169273.1 hypothetical protein [Simiduia aestuariiviva]
MSQQEPPKIEFPCENYPVKVMGDAGDALHVLVNEVMARHVAEFHPGLVTVRDSSKGRFQSLTVMITATGEDQLQAIFQDLKKNPIVRMVL